jgi:hypothetical protein
MTPTLKPRDSFGHEPVPSEWAIAFGYDSNVCRRCRKRSMSVEDDYGTTHPGQLEPVSWPCTSAIVLGLVPRPTAAVGER